MSFPCNVTNSQTLQPGSLRQGQVILENQPFTSRMLHVLRKELVEVSLLLQGHSSHTIDKHQFEDITLHVRHHLGMWKIAEYGGVRR